MPAFASCRYFPKGMMNVENLKMSPGRISSFRANAHLGGGGKGINTPPTLHRGACPPHVVASWVKSLVLVLIPSRLAGASEARLGLRCCASVPVYGAEETSTWEWRGHKIRFASAGNRGSAAPAIVMVHGFGSSADTWRKQYKDYAAAG